jgi:hypothetical protein
MGLPISGELTDLSEDPELSKAVFNEINRVILLTEGVANISGYARQGIEAFLYVQVWDQEELLRTLAFQDVGYAGIVHLDLIRPENGEKLYEGDLLADIFHDMDEYFSLSDWTLRNRIWVVKGGNLQFEIPLTDWATPRNLPCFGYYVGGNFPPD